MQSACPAAFTPDTRMVKPAMPLTIHLSACGRPDVDGLATDAPVSPNCDRDGGDAC